MFNIISAYGITKQADAQWQTHDIKLLTPSQANLMFRKLFITLKAPSQPEAFNIELESVMVDIGWMEENLEQIFAAWDNKPFVQVPLPQYKAERVIFGEFFRLGYTVNRAKPGSHYSATALPSEKTELQITRSDVDMERFSKQCVVMSNGYLYMHDYSNDTVFVDGPGYALNHGKRRNNLGFLSFEKIGNVKQYRITPEMVRKASPQTKIGDKCLVEIPEEVDLTGKTLLVVIAGHLYFMDGVMRQISDRAIRVRTELIPVMERFLESRDCIDYTSLGLANHMGDRFALEEFYSDDVMRNYIGHAQSFFLVVDTPRISYAKRWIKSLPIPGRFISREKPVAPIRVGHNRFAEYWTLNDYGEWMVCIADPYQGNRQYTRIPYTEEGQTSPSNVPYQITVDTHAHFLDIIADVAQ